MPSGIIMELAVQFSKALFPIAVTVYPLGDLLGIIISSTVEEFEPVTVQVLPSEFNT